MWGRMFQKLVTTEIVGLLADSAYLGWFKAKILINILLPCPENYSSQTSFECRFCSLIKIPPSASNELSIYILSCGMG